jgi:hypothetical protein
MKSIKIMAFCFWMALLSFPAFGQENQDSLAKIKKKYFPDLELS